MSRARRLRLEALERTNVIKMQVGMPLGAKLQNSTHKQASFGVLKMSSTDVLKLMHVMID